MTVTITPEEYKALLQPTGNAGKKPRKRRSRNPGHVSESLVVSSCIKWLWNHGCFIWRNNTGGFRDKTGRMVKYGAVGSPDIIGMTPTGRFIGVECKSPTGGGLTEHQERFRERVIEHDGIYIVARSVNDLEWEKGAILA